MVGRQAERVVDVQDQRVARTQPLNALDPDARVDARQVELVQLDHLRIDIDVEDLLGMR
ncbi:MAG: hypothetical protein IPP13_14830 [Kouleothrix sp.]|nr:hypothetical protein [Kouleothrix sp.]